MLSSNFFGVVVVKTLLLDFSRLIKWTFICMAFHDSKEIEQDRSTVSMEGSYEQTGIKVL